MKKRIIMTLTFLLLSCNTQAGSNELVLKYSDFGPQVIAYEIIEMAWWQWNEHGDSRPTNHDIRVVVYKSIDLKEIMRRYPVVESKQQDYRYVTYQDAIQFLNDKVQENTVPAVTERLKNTLNLLDEKFGE